MQKTLRDVAVKNVDLGEVEAVFSTFNVVDKDGDVTLPGAFREGQEVVISAYGHESWFGVLPVGKGVIRATKTEAILEGKFFLDTTAGRDTFTVVKNLAEAGLGEWSYGYDIEESELGKHEDQDVQFLKALNVFEVSPVLRGAGVDTRTLATKSDKTLQEQIADAMGVVSQVIESTDRVVALRAEKGKALSQVNATSLDGLRVNLERLKALLDPEATPAETPDEDIAREYLRFLKLTQGV